MATAQLIVRERDDSVTCVTDDCTSNMVGILFGDSLTSVVVCVAGCLRFRIDETQQMAAGIVGPVGCVVQAVDFGDTLATGVEDVTSRLAFGINRLNLLARLVVNRLCLAGDRVGTGYVASEFIVNGVIADVVGISADLRPSLFPAAKAPQFRRQHSHTSPRLRSTNPAHPQANDASAP